MSTSIKSKLLAGLFALLFFQYSIAQTISGIVLDARTKDPLVGANVSQKNTTNGTSTDASGKFEFSLDNEANGILVISFIGYKTQMLELTESSKNLTIYLLPETFISDEVFVEATRVDESTPMSYTNVSKSDIDEKNLGQDVPYLLAETPSVVTTSDAGAGIGYSGIRIRGVDPARINVTINGIPVNDAESHGVYWVDLPDIASSIENIQVQRGVGTSTNGAGAFGASINLQTGSSKLDPYAEVNTGIGSFNTQKANILLGSGLMKDGWLFEGRFSKITSDGYIDRATSDLNSFYLSGSKRGKRSLLKADIISGKEVTYQAWNGVEESIMKTNRTYNEAGTEKAGEPYDNEVDNYRQNYYQLHYSYMISDSWTANASLHYTTGKGYYEQYKADQDLSEYGITPVSDEFSTSDLIRRRWLDNDYYGMVFSSKYEKKGKWELTVGGGIHQYDGGHYGEVIWARNAGNSEIDQRYYDNDANKTDVNIYAKWNYLLSENINTYLDLQYRNINYEFQGLAVNDGVSTPIDDSDNLGFFNPKAGIVVRLNGNQRVFASFGVAGKEPTRDEYVNSTSKSRPSAEKLYNLETGYRADFSKFYMEANVYAMYYKDQLILTGQINDVGEYIRRNVPDSYRMGIELQSGVSLSKSFSWSGNLTLSTNKIDKYTYFLDRYDENWDYAGQVEKVYKNTDIAFSPSVIFNNIFGFKKAGWNAELVSKYVSRQYLDNTETKSRSIEAYFVNNVRLSYAFTNLTFVKGITATLQVNNIFDQEYETNGYTYGWLEDTTPVNVNYYFPQAGTNFLFQVKWEF